MMRRVGMRVAILALCSTTMVGMMVAQDTARAAPTQQGDGQRPPAGGRSWPGGRGGGMGGERQVEMLTKQLNLSADQVTQLKSIDADAMTQMKRLRDDAAIARDDKRAKTIRTDAQAKIKALLDDGQKQKYEKLQAKMQERMGDRAMGQGGGRGRGMGGNAPPSAPPQ